MYNELGEPPYCNDTPDCIPLSDDFLQYWLGAYLHIDAGDQQGPALRRCRCTHRRPFGNFDFQLNGAGSADNQEHVYTLVTTSSVCRKRATRSSTPIWR